MKFVEKIIKSLPGINSLYKSIKQLVTTVFPRTIANRSGRRSGTFSTQGFLVSGVPYGSVPDNLKPETGGDYLAVFMPSTPNPTTGFVMIVPKKDVKPMDISVEDAFKVIMSGGLIMEEKTTRMKIEPAAAMNGLQNAKVVEGDREAVLHSRDPVRKPNVSPRALTPALEWTVVCGFGLGYLAEY
jgi:uncharacterized membrane protein